MAVDTLVLQNSQPSKVQESKLSFDFLKKWPLKYKLGSVVALILLGLSLNLQQDSQNKANINPVKTIDPAVQEINNQIVQTIAVESVPQRQAEYIDLAAQVNIAFIEGRYCDYSNLLYEQARLILDKENLTTEDLTRAYGTLQLAAGPNPFSDKVQLGIIEAMVGLGMDTNSRIDELTTANNIESACEQ